MNCFLIDFENVRSNGLKGIEHLKNIDDVCIFYSDYANSITFDIHHSMNKSSANINFFKSTKTGKNALDFQLVSYLGYLIAQKKYKNYYIITGDRGFESAISFWKDFFKNNNMSYLNIGRFYTIKEASETKVFPSKTIKDTSPTIPTVETELELRQLKAESVMRDVNSKKIENQFENSLNKTNNVEKVEKLVNSSNPVHTMESIPKSKENTPPVTKKDIPKPTINNANKSNDDNKSQPQNSFKPLSNKNDNKPKNKNKNPNKNGNNVFKKVNNNDNNPNKTINNKPLKDDTIKPVPQVQKPSTMIFGKVNLNDDISTIENIEKKTSQPKAFQKKQETTKKFSPNSKKDIPKVEETPKVKKVTKDLPPKPPVVEEIKTVEKTSKIEENSPKVEETSKPKNITKDLPPRPPVVEEIKTVEKTPKIEENSPKVEETSKPKNITKDLPPKPPVVEEIKTVEKTPKIEDNSPKIEETPKVKNIAKDLPSKPPVVEEIKTVEKTSKIEENSPKVEETPKVKNITKDLPPKPPIEDKSGKASTVVKRRGRPRTKPISDKKPKNITKYDNEIPKDKLSKMLEQVSKLINTSDYSQEDLTNICKLVAFGTKNETYRTLMSLLGKEKTLKIFKVIKQEFDNLKKLYEN